MTISDYSALLIDAGEYSGRNDIAHMFPRFVGLAEAKINRVLRTADMEKTGTVALADGEALLPPDFLEARTVYGPDGQGLYAWSLDEMNRRYGNRGGLPLGYAVVGNAMRVRPVSAGSIVLDYYAAIPALTRSNPVNWLLTKAPDVYLHAIVEEIGIWERDGEKAAGARAMKEAAMMGLDLQDERSRWGNGQFLLGGIAP